MVPRTIRPYVRMNSFFIGGILLHTEYEVRILDINPEGVIQKLEELGASFQWDRV